MDNRPVYVSPSHVIEKQKVTFKCIDVENPILDCFYSWCIFEGTVWRVKNFDLTLNWKYFSYFIRNSSCLNPWIVQQLEFHLAIIYSVFTMTNPRAPLAFESKPVAFLYYLLAYLSASGNNRNFKWSRFLVIMLLIMISDYHLERENMVLNFSHGFSPPGFRLPSVKVD